MHWIKQPPLPVLVKILVGDELIFQPCPSSWSALTHLRSSLRLSWFWVVPTSWGHAKTCPCPKGEDLSQQLIKYATIFSSGKDGERGVCVCSLLGDIHLPLFVCLLPAHWTCEHKPRWPPEPEAQAKCLLDGCHENQHQIGVLSPFQEIARDLEGGWRMGRWHPPAATVSGEFSGGPCMYIKLEAYSSGWSFYKKQTVLFQGRVGAFQCELWRVSHRESLWAP